ARKRFEIEVVTGTSARAVAAAESGTVQDGDMVYQLDGKTYRTSIKTLRGDYRQTDGSTGNRLRRWEKSEFGPRPDDTFQERLYAIQWITKATLNAGRQETYFAAPNNDDLKREQRVEEIVAENLSRWQEEGLVPDMVIEPGDKTDEPIRTRGWTHWHHLYNARQLLLQALMLKHWRASNAAPLGWLNVAKAADFNSKLCRWATAQGGGLGGPKGVFSNQALNTFYNYATRAWLGFGASSFKMAEAPLPDVERSIVSTTADRPTQDCEFWITDPPYADAVNYHEITEFFIAWLRKNPPKPFDDWVWDSRRALAIKGSGEDFRRGMVAAYKAMAEHMPDNGMQCVMFTHQDIGVWGDLIGIFWAAGLQVVAAWYIATETTSELKKGGYVQGTVILMLKKRQAGERTGFKQRLLPAVRQEVARQIETMMHLNDTVKAHHGEPVFNDSDLQMAGYAAALKVLTAYTHIGGEDVTSFALRPRARGEVTVVDEIVQQAAETASSLLVPEGLTADAWAKLTGIERFVLRMLDMETTGSAKLDNYQNFAKAFHVEDYTRVMGDMRPNHARLKRVSEYASRELTDATEIGATRLGRLIIALQQLLKDTEPQVIVDQLRIEMADFLEIRPLLVDLLAFIERKSPEEEVRTAAEVLGARLKNLRFGA
ncbi:MAG: DNA methylase, partial [Pseudomonadota bacterium]